MRGRRLDFTVIGPDVNLVSRIESVCGTGSHELLMSGRFARLLEGDRTTSIGDHRLKGFGEPVELHTLRQSHHPQTAANRRRAS
jgi:adenylate cyclase